MYPNFDFLFLILNAAITCLLGLVTLYYIAIERLKKHLFYYAWSLGFILYAIQIIARAYFASLIVSAALMIPALFSFLLGLWSLSRGKGFLYIIIANVAVIVILSISYFLNLIQLDIAVVLGQSFWFLPIVIVILRQRVKFGKDVDKFAFGWFLLLLSNVLTFNYGWICDIFAIFSKLVMFLGIMNYEFVILAETIQRGIRPYLPPIDTGTKREGGLRLIISQSSNRIREIEWIKKIIQENTRKGLSTYLFSFQDVIPHMELRRIKWINPEEVSIFLFSTSAKKMQSEFTVIPMGITQIGATLSEVIKRSFNLEENCTVIFLNLSILIHLFEEIPVYNLLLNKMGGLREGGVELFAFVHPETHVNTPVKALFESISDEVIMI